MPVLMPWTIATDDDIIVDGDYNAGNGNVVLRSAGDIKGGGQITADGLGLDAPDGEIGSAAQPLRFDANTLTVGSRPFSTSPFCSASAISSAWRASARERSLPVSSSRAEW